MTQCFLAMNLTVRTGTMHTSKVFTIVCTRQIQAMLKVIWHSCVWIDLKAVEQICWPVCGGSRPLWCRCTGWPPSMARWGAGPHSSPGPRLLSASFWCQSAEAVEQEEQIVMNLLSPVFHTATSATMNTPTPPMALSLWHFVTQGRATFCCDAPCCVTGYTDKMRGVSSNPPSEHRMSGSFQAGRQVWHSSCYFW